ILLSALFYLLGLWFYLGYASKPDKKIQQYLACFFLFVLGLLSKQVTVTLPLVLLLLDIWPLGRFSAERPRIFFEKIPFFIAAFLVSWVTVIGRAQSESLMALKVLPISGRIMNAFHSVVFYLEKMIFPMDLAAFYPITEKTKNVSAENIFWVVLVILYFGIWFYWRQNRPYLIVGSFFYLITLSPMLGILQVGSHAAADRYAYLPCLGPFLIFSSMISAILRNRLWAFILLTMIIAASLGYGTFLQTRTWNNSINLWENVVKVSPGVSFLSYTKLGNAYQDAGRLDEAINAYD